MVNSLIGKTLGKYLIQEPLGRGAMAEVYKAYHPALDRHVAIKFLHSFLAEDKNFLARFKREAKAAGQLRHPNIVQVYDFDVADGVYYYIVMEHLDGVSLDDRLQEFSARNEIMPLAEALRIATDVASALSYAHSRGMVHRDIKPSNVMIGQDDHVTLTDFGIAKILSDAQHTSSGTVGTPNYISPEQGLGKSADPRSDIYSLGAVFYQMVTGQLPYHADSAVVVLLKHVNDPVPVPSRLNPALPAGVDAVIARAMSKNPEDRFQTADAFVDHLKQVEADIAQVDQDAYRRPVTPPLDRAATLFLTSVTLPTSQVASFSDAISLPPYVLSVGHVATDPADLPKVCDSNWERAVDHFTKGYITEWLRAGVKQLRSAHRHGLADELESIAARAEAIIRRIQPGDEMGRNAGLEEFLESLGATPPGMSIAPNRLDLPTVGVGMDGQPVTLTITGLGRGYLFGSVTCRVPWLRATPEVFGCSEGKSFTIMVIPDLSGLPAGRIQSADGLQLRSIAGDQHLPVRVDILPSALKVDAPALDFGIVGQGEVVRTIFTLGNRGQGLLTGQVRCRVPWLTASPEQFHVPAGETIEIVTVAETQAIPAGDAVHEWALVVESNGGHAVMGVHVHVLSPRLTVAPPQIDLGAIDLANPDTGGHADLIVQNTGPGVLTGALVTMGDWLTVEPATFRCRSSEAQPLHLSIAKLKTGDFSQTVQVVSNAGVAGVPVRARVRFSLEPEMANVPAGWFLRGSDERDRAAAPGEKPQRQIYLSEYWIGKYLVTNAQYAVFVDAAGRKPPEHWIDGRPPEGQENHPVVNVSWWDAVSYCRWLAEMTDKPYRLPTEAQWEKGARGSDGRLYPWGSRWENGVCNAHEARQRGTTPVGTFSPAGDSPYGCADMAGNALEWVADWYKEDYYARSTVSHDPFGSASGAVKVLRGGSWSSTQRGVTCAARLGSSQTTTNLEIGFRCAMFETQEPNPAGKQST